MSHPIQTDRLELGHIATFRCEDGSEVRYRIGEANDMTTEPETHSIHWLAPFVGKCVGHRAEVAAPEGNVTWMRLLKLEIPEQLAA
ncbi:MAG: hypothetical protein JWO84_467 [Parcubacteria group bacterium]|nr:hypothetical protein [Parcubacteria group bacterium]